MAKADSEVTGEPTRGSVLAGVTVVDLSRFIAGPMCGMLLGDLGADVIKVERIGGEDSRQIQLNAHGQSLYTNWFNRNKRAMTLDMRSAEGLRLLETLISKADVLLENFRPGTLARMGLTPERLRELNDDLVVTSVSGFGQDGPFADRAAFDSVIQAMSGLMSLTGNQESGPMLAGMFVADHLAALYATIGTVGALHERRDSGRGQRVDVALLDALFACMGMAAPSYLDQGTLFPPIENRDRFTAPSQAFPTADGHVFLSAGSDKLFAALASVVNDDRLRAPEFGTPALRVQHRDALADIIRGWTTTLPTAELCDLLEISQIPYGPISTFDEVVTSEHVKHREMVLTVRHPVAGDCIVPGVPVKMSGTPGTVRRPPPMIGEHTDEILREFCDLTEDDIDRMRAAHVV